MNLPLKAFLAASLLALLLAAAPPAWAAAPRTITEIRFEGNEVTQEVTLRRELLIKEGDAADDEQVEKSRQAILDLGLFRSVQARQEPVRRGVRVVFVVREKWYLLPYPRLSANSDGQNSIGAEIRWNNLWGLNHSLRAIARSRDAKEEGRGRELSYRLAYDAPFLFDSGYGVNLGLSHSITPISDAGGVETHEEIVDDAQLLLTRRLFVDEDRPASQGWSLGTGLLWRSLGTVGEKAPPPAGDAYAFVSQLDYRNLRDQVYSETGNIFGARYEVADRRAGSDYSYSRLTAKALSSLPFGASAHQTLEFSAEMGLANNGPDSQPDFSLGGTKGLRGFERNAFEGDFYYLASVQLARPVFRPWLRVVAGIEAGNAHREADFIDRKPHLSLNLGFRAKLPRFVNFEIEAGFALPLDGGGGGRFYGDRGDF